MYRSVGSGILCDVMPIIDNSNVFEWNIYCSFIIIIVLASISSLPNKFGVKAFDFN